MTHQILSRETVFTAHAFEVEALNVRLPDQRIRQYDLVNHRDSATILPIDQDGDIWFVRQYRMGSESELLELPAGVMDDQETAMDCALREIREEIGMAAGDMQQIGSMYLVPGYSNELNHVFLARKLTPSPLDKDEDEFLSIQKIHIHEIRQLVEKSGLIDGKSLAALFLAWPKLTE